MPDALLLTHRCEKLNANIFSPCKQDPRHLAPSFFSFRGLVGSWLAQHSGYHLSEPPPIKHASLSGLVLTRSLQGSSACHFFGPSTQHGAEHARLRNGQVTYTPCHWPPTEWTLQRSLVSLVPRLDVRLSNFEISRICPPSRPCPCSAQPRVSMQCPTSEYPCNAQPLSILQYPLRKYPCNESRNVFSDANRNFWRREIIVGGRTTLYKVASAKHRRCCAPHLLAFVSSCPKHPLPYCKALGLTATYS